MHAGGFLFHFVDDFFPSFINLLLFKLYLYVWIKISPTSMDCTPVNSFSSHSCLCNQTLQILEGLTAPWRCNQAHFELFVWTKTSVRIQSHGLPPDSPFIYPNISTGLYLEAHTAPTAIISCFNQKELLAAKLGIQQSLLHCFIDSPLGSINI